MSFFTRPLSLVLIGLICATIVWALYSNVKGKNSMPAGAGTGG